MSEATKGAGEPPNNDRPNPLSKLPPDAPPGAKYRLNEGIYVDEIGQEVKRADKPAPPRPNPTPQPQPLPQEK